MITDLKYALRMLLKAPGFTVIAVLTLALGIGANSAIFSVIDTVLLRALPFPEPDQIVMVWGRTLRDGGSDRNNHSFPDYADFRDQSQSFAAIAAYARTGATLLQGDEGQPLAGIAVTAEIFEALGMSPFLGRGYSRDEDKAGAPPVVVITHPLWQRAFGSDPKVVGQQIMLSGRSCTLLGVMPAGWKFPVESQKIDYLMPLQSMSGANELNNRGAHFMDIVGRLKPGVSRPQAEAELTAIAGRLSQQYPDTNTNFASVAIVPLHESIVGDVRPTLLILLGAVALVLLIACANVANLLLARAAARSREIAIRTALGASRSRIVRQLLCESFLLALLGGLGGLFLAWWGVDLLSALGPRGVPRLNEVSVNTTVTAFTFLVAIVSTLAFGLVPALQVSRGDVNEALQQGAKGSTGGLHANRIRAALVISQVALSLLLLAGAGLLIKSFVNLQNTKLGYNPERVITFSLGLPRVKYPEEEAQIRTFDRILEKLATVPGIEAIGAVNPLPLSNSIRASSLMVSGAAPVPPGQHPGAGHLIVTGDYFQAMRTPVLSGRAIDRRDTKDSPLVVMINEAFAKKFFPDRDPIGQQVMIDRNDDQSPPCEVIGVVANTRHDTLRDNPGPEFYVPLSQDPGRALDFVLRTSAANLAGLDRAVKAAVQSVDKDLFVPTLRPMEYYLSQQLMQPRFNMLLLAIFAGVAMILAAIGIYGVIAYSVAQRTREIGIRMALGAQRGQMMGMMLRQSLVLVAVGLVLGLLAALATTRLLGALLYGVSANDLSTYAAVVFLLGGAALFASYIPARRAMKVDPMVALRHE
ncbi:MAG: ABC transporter permease [Verrucomicrobiota bacterium]|nr:ABC transporter permease [Verrucomicrobiota bacterium]